MICPMVATQMKAYYGDGRGYPPIKMPEFQCAKEYCEWWDKEKKQCNEVSKRQALEAIAKALNSTLKIDGKVHTHPF